MSQMASFSVNDGQATPVAHTFNPKTERDGKAVWRTETNSLNTGNVSAYAFQQQLTHTRTTVKTALGPTVLKDRFVLEHPYSGSQLDQQDKILRLGKIVVEVHAPDVGSEAERKNLTVMAKNLLDNAQVQDILWKLGMPY